MVQIQFDIPPKENKNLNIFMAHKEIKDKRKAILIILGEYFDKQR